MDDGKQGSVRLDQNLLRKYQEKSSFVVVADFVEVQTQEYFPITLNEA